MFTKLIKLVLIKISRIIFWITPIEFKPPNKRNKLLKEKLDERIINETLINFEENIQKSLIFTDRSLIREYAIKESLLNDAFVIDFSPNFLQLYVMYCYVCLLCSYVFVYH